MPRWTRMSLGAALVAAALLLAGSHAVPLLDPDEARYARTSVEMLRTGDLVVPSFEGRPRLVKPPLAHWLQAATFTVTGPTELGARLPSALATLGTLAIVIGVARRRFGPEAGFWAGAAWITMPLVAILGRVGTLDALLALHVTAVVALDLAPGARPGRRAPLVGALLGLAFMVKGPVGVALPLLMMLAGRTASRREVVPGVGVALRALAGWAVVVLPWGLAFLHRVGGGAVGATLREEVLTRFFAGTSHAKPWWFYGPVLVVATLPWAAALASALVRVVRRPGDPARATARYLAASLVAGLVMLTLSRGKLPSYLAPLMAPAALLLAWEAGRQIAERGSRRTATLLLAGWSLVVALVFAVAARQVAADPGPRSGLAAALAAGCFAAAGLVAAEAGRRRRPRLAWGAVAVAGTLALGAAFGLALPELAVEKSARGLVRRVPELTEPRPLVVVAMKLPSLTFYLDRIPTEIPAGAVADRIAEPDRPVLVFDSRDLAALDPAVRARLSELGRAGKYVVMEGPPDRLTPSGASR